MERTQSAERPHPRQRRLANAVLAAAVLQVVAPIATINGPGASPGSGSGAELLITPVGWAFSIWGVIYALAIVQAVSTMAKRDRRVPLRLQLDQIGLYLGGTLWILMAALDSSTATFLALALMFGFAVDGVLTLARTGHELAPRGHRTLTRIAFGLYAGWVSAAFFLNLSTAMVGWGLVDADDVGWQLAVVAVATVTLVALVLVGRLAAYAAAGLWALLGIAVTGLSDGTDAVVVAASVAAVALLVAAVVGLRRGAAVGHRG
ncbi:MFS transporter [Nocardioides zeae]|uniref:MFS transporter n=1 Tax=Nocardioides zeae TaxID=1457234 RepID=A0A6P0HJ95_9ACTN|nr:MFS transporter [Nocardioides zeae]NEN78681.1 MFS transporter [Nocardioides zeae]